VLDCVHTNPTDILLLRDTLLCDHYKQAGYFFKDCSDKIIEDEVLTELLAFHNVILTAHQAFFTQEAIDKIVGTTIENIVEFMNGKKGRDHPNTIFS
jgi:D-lactate dehydrogenase